MPSLDSAGAARADRDIQFVLDRALPMVALLFTATAMVSAQKRYGQPGFEEHVSPWAWGLPLLLAGLLAVRRRFPVAVLVLSVVTLLAYYAAGQPAIGLELPLVAAFFSAAQQGRFRVGVITALTLLVFSYGWRAVFGSQSFLALVGLDLMTSVVVLAGAIGTGDAVRARAAERAARSERHRLERELLEDHVLAETDAARRAIARDVHDVLGHAMVAVTTQANVALESLDDDPAAARVSLLTIKATSQQALRDIRGSLALLSPDDESRHPVSTLDDLDELIGRFEGTGLTVEVQRDDALPSIPASVSSTGYRVVQESLTNAVRHGDARRVRVRLSRNGSDLLVEVGDNGRGATTFTPGNGLRGMRERVALVGGTLDTGPVPEGGFRVAARMPAGWRAAG